jgi:chromosomal replication initiation ATPase DnaA
MIRERIIDQIVMARTALQMGDIVSGIRHVERAEALAKHGEMPKEITTANVLFAVASAYRVNESDIMSNSREKQHVRARRAYSILARKHARASYPEIARTISRVGHSSIVGHQFFHGEKETDEYALADMSLAAITKKADI